MNRTDLINAAADKSGLTKRDTDRALTAILESITDALASGEKVQLVGFGVFEIKKREARIGYNPRTREEIQIPASKVPQFKPGKSFKEALAD